MIELSHDGLTYFAKSWGLFYLIAISIGVLIYAYRPSKKASFDRAAQQILDPADRPVTARNGDRDPTDPAGAERR